MEQHPRNAERGGGDYFEIRRVENQRPAREADAESLRVIIFRIEAPAFNPLRIFHAIERRKAGGRSFRSDIIFNFSHFGRG